MWNSLLRPKASVLLPPYFLSFCVDSAQGLAGRCQDSQHTAIWIWCQIMLECSRHPEKPDIHTFCTDVSMYWFLFRYSGDPLSNDAKEDFTHHIKQGDWWLTDVRRILVLCDQDPTCPTPRFGCSPSPMLFSWASRETSECLACSHTPCMGLHPFGTKADAVLALDCVFHLFPGQRSDLKLMFCWVTWWYVWWDSQMFVAFLIRMCCFQVLLHVLD